MRRFLFILFCLLAFLFLEAQQFGGNPPSVKWKQINTDAARVIFPEGMDSAGQRVASIVNYLAAHSSVDTGLSLGKQLHKVNIVLQNQTIIANGYVGLGPFRSEFFLTPELNNFDEGSIPWSDQLAVHEYRHVMQYNNFRNGLSKLMYHLFGDDGLSLATNAAVPDWFFEGDAVYNETITTNQGRGRLPFFLNAYPSLWQANKKYSWMKLRNGSLKDHIPNHYYLGYLLVNYGREKYGLDFWTKVTHDASAYKGLFYPFQSAIKRYAGIDYKTFYNDAFNYYKKLHVEKLSSDIQLNGATQGTMPNGRDAGNMLRQAQHDITPVNKNYVTNYYFPYGVGKDSLLYLKTSYRKRPAFFIKDNSGEHKLRLRDISIDEQFSYRNGKIVYAAYENDARWAWRDYGVIKMLDVETGRQQTVTHHTKYFTPDISDDGKRIAAVHVDANGKSELHIIDASNGSVLKVIRSGEINLFTDPKFIDDNTLVTAVRLYDGRMALAMADLQMGSTVRLTPPSFNVVGYPCVNNGMIYFAASYGGNDDVFALRLSDKKIFKITNGPLGNYFVTLRQAQGDTIVTWSAFTAEGYQLKQMSVKDIAWNEVSVAEEEALLPKFNVSYSDRLNDLLLTKVPAGNYPVNKYKKGTRLINFHSWRPYYSDPEFSFSIYGENILNTLQTELYYLYNQNEKTNAVGMRAVYGAWFPYLNFGTEYTFDRTDIIANKTRHWDQLDSYIGLNVPLSITSGTTYKDFNIGSYYVQRNEFNKGFFKDSIGNSSYSYLQHFISWSQQVQKARQHIYPRWGYALSAIHHHAITKYDGYRFIGNAAVYLPGFFSTHSIVLTGSFQQRDTVRALFSSLIADARGYSDYYRTTAGSRMWRLSANYHLPLLIPDWGFGNILYLQRIRANIFYDQQRLYSNNKFNTADLRSAGGELYVDTKWWNQYALTFGIRVSHLLNNDPRAGLAKGSNVFEFILPVSIIPR